PVETHAVIDGVNLQNANGESCGGTFAEAFAQSCNSVFAPLGVKLGAKRLVATAERFGFNETPSVPGEAPSTLPPAPAIDSARAGRPPRRRRGSSSRPASRPSTDGSDVELDAAGLGPAGRRVGRRDDLEVERPVLERRQRELEDE